MVSTLVARRLGRIAFGCVLLVGLACLVRDVLGERPRRGLLGSPAILTATWIAALAAYRVVRAGAMRSPPRDPARLFAVSVIVPVVGISLLLPITFHLPFALLLGGTEGFAEWLEVCIPVTGPAHIAFAIMVAVHARQLVVGKRPFPRHWIYVITVVVSCVPFAILLMIPPMLVAVTGTLFIPMLGLLKTLVEAERAEAPPTFLPMAHVLAGTHNGPARRTR